MNPMSSVLFETKEVLSSADREETAFKDKDKMYSESRRSRRRRGGKGRKQQSSKVPKDSPPVDDEYENENKENQFKKFEDLVIQEEENNEENYSSFSSSSSEKKSNFIWKNITQNGSIKKCILVTGLMDGGRPQVSDVVLIKSQGKLKSGQIVDDYPTQVFHIGDYEVIEGLDLAVRSMYKNELSIVSIKPEMAYGSLGRKNDIPPGSRITYLLGLLHFEKEKDIKSLTVAQRRKSGQSRMRLAHWWYQRKDYSIAVKCYKKALYFYNDIPKYSECSTPEEYKELLILMEERLRVMRQVANIFKRIANLLQSGQIEPV